MIPQLLNYSNILWGFLKYHKKHAFFCVFLISLNSIVLGGTLSLLLPIITYLFPSGIASIESTSGFFGKVMEVYKNNIGASPHRELLSIVVLFIMMFLSSGLRFLSIYVNSGLTAKITCDCREKIYSAIQKMSIQEFSRHQRGMYVQLLITETRSVYAIFKQLLNVIATIGNTFVVVLILMLLSWKLCVVLFCFYLFTVWANISVNRSIKKLAGIAIIVRSELANKVTESIWGLKQLKMFQAEAYMKEKLNQVSTKSENIAKELLIKNGLLPVITQNMLLVGIIVIVCIWLLFPVFSEEIPQVAGLITFLVIVGKLSLLVGSISKEYGSILSNRPALLRVQEFLSQDHFDESEGFLEPVSFLKEAIHLQDVNFEYSTDKPILNNLSIKINKGSYIGIVGTSGGGKSTLFDLLVGFYRPKSGNIRIDGIDIQKIRLTYLRSKIGLVSQDFFLFNNTIRENMLLAKPLATEQELWVALKRAGLKEFIESQKDGLDTLVGNNGENLSGGQRQRLSLAIVFLNSPEVIILDEGTSSVDNETEKHILHSIMEMHKQGKTIIFSAHKESALVDAESIYELNYGKLTKIR